MMSVLYFVELVDVYHYHHFHKYALTDEGYTLKRVHCVAFPFSTSGNSWQWSITVLLSFIYSSCQHFWLLWIFILINVKSDPFPCFSATPLSPSWCDDISAENRHGLKQVMKEFAYREYQNTTINQWTFKACLTTIIFIYISTLNPHIIQFFWLPSLKASLAISRDQNTSPQRNGILESPHLGASHF